MKFLFEYDLYLITINPLECFFSNKGHVVQDRNLGPRFDTALFQLIPGDL